MDKIWLKSMVKRVFIILSYWMIAVLLIAVILTSLDLNYFYALYYSLVFVPIALIAKIIVPAPAPGKDSTDLKQFIFIALGLLALCFALIFCVSWFIYILEDNYMIQDIGTPRMLTNPAFLVSMIMLLLAGDYFIGLRIDKAHPVKDLSVDFISNRKKIQLKQADILFIESNDTEVWIHDSKGNKFRNKTPIGQWETRLGRGFARISRSYLVNRDSITEIGPGYVALGDMRFASSKKYVPDSSPAERLRP